MKMIWIFILYIACLVGLVFCIVQVVSEIEIRGMAQQNRGSVGMQEARPQPEQIMQDSTCSTTLRLQGKPYPRTCKKCGLGPCIAQPSAQTEQEPVAWIYDPITERIITPQRPWIGLTDEEIKVMDAGFISNASFYAGAFWAEAKLKEKNT